MRLVAPLTLSCLLTLLLFIRQGVGQEKTSPHLTLGNPSNAKSNAENCLVVKKQFAMSFNNKTATANWVSWHLETADVGRAVRTNDFRLDDDLPDKLFHVSPDDYKNTGFDKGHLCPSGDRTKLKADCSATFVMSNMMPQAPRNNRQTWRLLETFCRNEIKKKQELYIIAGPIGIGGSGSKGTKSSIGQDVKIVVPHTTWKVILFLPQADGDDLDRVSKTTRAIGVIMPNSQEIRPDWQRYQVPVRRIEELTGLNFFSLVKKNIQDEIEN
jgi:endonuclease G